MPETTLYGLFRLWTEENGSLFTEATVSLYSGLMEKHVIPFFGNGTDISGARMDAFAAESGLSGSTLYMIRRIVWRSLSYGAARGLCAPPEWEPGPDKGERRRAVILSADDRERVLRCLADAPDGPHLGLFLMLQCGLAPGEAAALRWGDVALQSGEIRIGTGNVKSRKVPIGEREKIYLRKLKASPDAFILTGHSGDPRQAILRERLLRLCDALILPPMAPMDLRRTYAVHCLEAGMPAQLLLERLGLSSVKELRADYLPLVSEPVRARMEREALESRKARKAPEHISMPPEDPAVAALRRKVEKKKAELRDELANLEGDLQIINALRNNDGVQGAAREGFYRFVEKVLGPSDKDGLLLVEYLRSNMRVAAMPSRATLSVQAIRRRVSHGFARLCAFLDKVEK